MPTSFTKLKRIVATLLLAAMPAALLPAERVRFESHGPHR
jgi:hypothetical protein